jgi:type II secretory pathway pseudopilin PulG
MRRQRGFSYVVVMFLVAVLSIASARALENSMMTERRRKEAQLLRVGQIYRDAIRDYYIGTQGSAKQLPKTVDDLLLDVRSGALRRPLRKRYRDPITDATQWGAIYKDERLIGVYSLSPLRPLKRDGFAPEQKGFNHAATYQDWLFIYEPW